MVKYNRFRISAEQNNNEVNKMGELDPQLDEKNVYIRPTFWCGACNREMSRIGMTAYKCGECEQTWLEK